MQQNQFKLVCDGCGSLTVALPSKVESVPFVVLKCGRCGSPRGTLQALREMSLGARHLEAQMQDANASLSGFSSADVGIIFGGVDHSLSQHDQETYNAAGGI
jgi:hypothetical protein